MRRLASGHRPWSRRAIEKEAAEWLASREASAWTPAEHASFADWRARSAEHAAIFAELEGAWRTFDALAAYPHSADRAAEPDLLGRERPPRRLALRRSAALSMIAASVLFAAVFWLGGFEGESSPGAVIAVDAGRLVRLSDGSVVELNVGAELVEKFTSGERRVLLRGGEAHFSVARNPERPFVVEAGGAAVRAVGTSFNVRMDIDRIEVLVTEGKVEVALQPGGQPLTHQSGTDADNAFELPAVPVPLTAGQRSVLEREPVSGRLGAVVVDTLAAPDIDRILSWQTGRLQFDATPLRDAVAQFNARSGGPRLVLGDVAVGDVLVSGRIRAENVDHFVEVLVSGFDVDAQRNGGDIVLRRRR